MGVLEPSLRAALAVFRPPPRLSVSQWADQFRQLSREASSEPGQWRTSRAQYQRDILDAISDPLTHTVVVMSCAQVGKTELLLNAIGYHIAQDAAPMLFLQPTVEMAETVAKDRIAPLVRDTPCLTALIAEPLSRSGGNTILHKQFPGGHLTLAGANSPASLASRPIRIVFCDEVDRYPPSAGTEGDPITLVRARTKTFHNRKMVLTSTPTIKGVSRIEQAYDESDRRVYEVPCPHCRAPQRLLWAGVRWTTGRTETAAYHCVECGAAWSDAQRLAAIRKGQWVARAPFTGVAGFHLNELCSPWSRVADMARSFVEAKASRSQERMRAWINTTLGETWEQDGERVDETSIASRAEQWSGEPDGVLFRTAGVDVQDDRLEVELVGWGRDEESWSLDYNVIFGDPSGPTLWADLDRYLLDRKPSATCVDSGGHHTQAVYKFCRERSRRRVYAIKGMAGPGRPVWPKRSSKGMAGKAVLFLVGVDAAKDQVFAHLKLTTAGPGFCHFPADRDERYYAGLSSETVVTKYAKGFPIREYRKRAGVRNEPLDCRVYAYCALISLNVRNWTSLERAKEAAKPAAEAPASSPTLPDPQPLSLRQPIRPPRPSFVKRW
jgi:phage terminase large subunit GpA-like protein